MKGKGGSFPICAFDKKDSIMCLKNAGSDIKTHPDSGVPVCRVLDPVEFIKYLFQIFLRNTDALIMDGNGHPVIFFVAAKLNGGPGPRIFSGVSNKVVQYLFDPQLVYIDILFLLVVKCQYDLMIRKQLFGGC